MNKSDLIAQLLLKHGDAKKYVVLCEDDNKRYIRYAFVDGCPENCDKLAAWTTELNVGEVYEVSGWTGDHWVINGSEPVDIDRLMNEKFELSANDIFNIVNNKS